MAGRTRGRRFPVFPSEGRKVIRWSTVADASIYEELGVWRREYDTQTGALDGFRLVGAETNKVDSDLRSIPSVPAIDMASMELYVGKSRTRGLREAERLKLIKNGEAPEDKIERVQAKVRVYRMVGAAKGDILIAWPRGGAKEQQEGTGGERRAS